jgi:hypothetical protein
VKNVNRAIDEQGGPCLYSGDNDTENDMERTQIIIRHADAETLKSHPIWKMITDLFLEDGPIFVEEIGALDDQPET